MKIVLISCVKTKLDRRAPARDLYTSPLFRLNLAYAQQMAPDAIYVLSSKYGLVALDQVIEPYELTLNALGERERRRWATGVLAALSRHADLQRDEFVFLAGMNYRKYLVPAMRHVEVPLEGLSFGEQLQELRRRIDEAHATRERPHAGPERGVHQAAGPTTGDAGEADSACARLHLLFNRLEIHGYPFGPERIPSDGIYVMFEAREAAHGGRRIVRVGSHTGRGQLPGRLAEHFAVENKDRSILRKNIGRAILDRDDDPFLDRWNLDLTSRAARDLHADRFDMARQAEMEAEVTRYIQRYFGFVAVPVADRTERLRWEAGIIATIARCPGCGPSPHWLGNHSPQAAIRESGLGNVQHLGGQPLTAAEVDEICRRWG